MRFRGAFRIRTVHLMAAVAGAAMLLMIHRTATRRVETLRSPIPVEGWSGSGLLLPAGKVVPLPGFASLPEHSAALAEVTKRGVEVGKDGRVYGLLRVHHWCGNDPIREHVSRVDVADLMAYLGEGKTSEAMPRPRWSLQHAASAFSPAGWRIEEFMGYCRWHEDMVGRRRP
ncbi:hypothetical protein [Aquisphaera insulae]|uniref:hypothetical protein n=1 Tax=Aquisphaera insulae TaxID=2712864 RepID=UPI0013EDC955|nr:hypothetical protein [Aquisphaera insulae]